MIVQLERPLRLSNHGHTVPAGELVRVTRRGDGWITEWGRFCVIVPYYELTYAVGATDIFERGAHTHA